MGNLVEMKGTVQIQEGAEVIILQRVVLRDGVFDELLKFAQLASPVVFALSCLCFCFGLCLAFAGFRITPAAFAVAFGIAFAFPTSMVCVFGVANKSLQCKQGSTNMQTNHFKMSTHLAICPFTPPHD